MVTIEDIKTIGNCNIDRYSGHKWEKDNVPGYSGDHTHWVDLTYPETNHIYYSDLSLMKNSEIYPESIEDLFLIPGYLSYGDYDNSCMVERSNYKIFFEDYKEEPGVFTISGGWGSTGIAISVKWLLDPVNEEKADEIIELLNGLNDYPCLNDEDMSNMEYDAFYEALKDYGISDTCTALAKKYGIDVTDYDSAKLEELILDIDRNGNPIFIIESGGICYIDIDDMVVPKITQDQFISALTKYEEVI